MNRAYSLIEVKNLDDGKRTFSGWATTPEVDRVNDTIDPLGASFKNPLVLLHQHDSRRPIGTVRFKKPTKAGIEFEAEIPVVKDAGPLKDRVDMAWGEIKAGLVRAVSIGFRSMKHAYKEDGGIEFQEIEIYELSTVSIPANSGALITSVGKSMGGEALAVVKSFDEKHLAASGRNGGSRRIFDPPGVSGIRNSDPEKGKDMNVSQQLERLESSRGAKQKRMEDILELTAKEGRSTSTDEQEEFDTLEQDIAALDGDLKRLRALEKSKAAGARQIADNRQQRDDDDAGGNGVQRRSPVNIKAPKEEPGLRLARYARYLGLSKHSPMEAMHYAQHLIKSDPLMALVLKAPVPAASVADTPWAGALVPDEVTSALADFVDYLRPQTILGKFGTNGIPSLRRIPFRTPILVQATGGNAYWTGEGKAKKLTSWTYSRTTLTPLKIANIAVLTMELLRDSRPSAELLIRDELAASLRATLDVDFIDPDNGGSPDVQPASITDNISPIPSSGNDAEAVRADIKAMFGAFIAANNPPMNGVWIMPATAALALSLMTNAFGQREFPNITMFGGTLEGLPVITSEFVPTVSAGGYVILVNASDIYLGDEGGIDIALSTEASLEMANDPTMDAIGAGTPAETTVVSMFQTNSIALRAERTINWARRRVSGVQVLSAVNWGAEEEG